MDSMSESETGMEESMTSFKEDSQEAPPDGGGVVVGGNCYCDCARDLTQTEWQCCRCLKWFHEKCLKTRVSGAKTLSFLTNYSFVCHVCGGQDGEVLQRRQTNFSGMCETALANLMRAHPQRVAFASREIIAFIEENWDLMTTMPRRIKQTWHVTVVKTMAKESETFIQDTRDPNDPHFALRNQDLSRVGPNYQQSMISGSGGQWSGRGAKRKQETEIFGGRRGQKSELSSPKLPANGFPTEYPFNKDGYRYVLAEPDPHGPHRQEFEDAQDLAGKPIPGWLCRKLMPQSAALSLHDRATQLKISDDRRLVTGDKGYCMVRANYGTNAGKWMFEVRVQDLPEGAAVRVGWAQELANIQAPLGYDKFGYSIRSKKGTRFHESRGLHFCGEGFSSGDVIGLALDLPESRQLLPKTYKDKPLVKFKSYLYFEEKDDIQSRVKQLTKTEKSRILVYKNGRCLGVAFTDLLSGTYYPSASLYRSSSLLFNFGPKLSFPLNDFKAVSEMVFSETVKQVLSDLLYFVENKDKLRLDLFYGQ